MAISKRMQARIDRRNAKTTHKVENPDESGQLYFPIRFTEETGKTSFIKLDPKNGDDIEELELDIMPFIIGDNFPDKTLIANEDEAAVLYYSVHRYWGEGAPEVICPRETFGKQHKCAICEEAWAAKDAAEAKIKAKGSDDKAWEDDLYKSLKAKKRVLYNAIDLNAKDDLKDKIQLYETSYWQFHNKKLEVAAKAKGKKTGQPIVFYEDLFEGYSLEITFQKSEYNSNPFYEPSSVVLKDRDYEYGEERYDEAIQLDQLMDVLSYETLQQMVQGDYSAVLGAPSSESEGEDTDQGTDSREEEQVDNEQTDTTKDSGDDKCPNGMVFGSGDFMTMDACHECELMEECGAVAEPEQAQEPVTKSKSTRTTRTRAKVTPKETPAKESDTKEVSKPKRTPRKPRTRK